MNWHSVAVLCSVGPHLWGSTFKVLLYHFQNWKSIVTLYWFDFLVKYKLSSIQETTTFKLLLSTPQTPRVPFKFIIFFEEHQTSSLWTICGNILVTPRHAALGIFLLLSLTWNYKEEVLTFWLHGEWSDFYSYHSIPLPEVLLKSLFGCCSSVLKSPSLSLPGDPLVNSSPFSCFLISSSF